MSLRLPQGLETAFSSDRVNDAFNHEVLAEKAASLGRAGKKLAAKLAQLTNATTDDDRALLTKEAAEAAYGYFIQRELCGLYSHQTVISDYDIPRAVLAQMGAQ